MAKRNKEDIKYNGLASIAEKIATNYTFNYMYRTAPVQRLTATYYNTRIELFTLRQDALNERYSSDGMFRTIVDQPVLDAFRGDLTIKTTQLDNDEIEELQFYLKENDILETIKQFFIWDRLFGGAGLIVDVEGQKLSEPFRIKNIQYDQRIKFYAVDRWELTNNPATQANQIQNAITPWGDFNYYGEPINPDRIILLKGKEAPSLVRQRLQGWGLSAVEPLIAPLNAYDKTKNLIYELMDEAKIDVWKLQGLNDSAMSKQDDDIVRRVEIANMTKNYTSSVVLDQEDEFIQKQLQLTGVADILQQQRLDICVAIKMPLTKVFGLSASGFNSGEDDIENYNSWVESELRSKIYNVLQKVISMVCKSLFDVIPTDLDLSFPELKTPKLQELEAKRLNDFKVGMDLYTNKFLTSKELADYLDEKELLTMDTKASRGELPEFSQGMATENFDKLDI